ncbi:HEAT repeat domain-containing protein, partial [Streptomyces kanamyceticus]
MINDMQAARETLQAEARTSTDMDALLYLYGVGGPEADAVVMDFIRRMSTARGKAYNAVIHGTAIRVAAEFDPDRDPGPFMDFLDMQPPSNRLIRAILRRSTATWDYPDTAPANSGWGYTRLRRLDPPPVERFTQRLAVPGSIIRVNAANALGDTADVAALSPLADALDDANPAVRSAGAAAVRRLRHAGAAAALHAHPAESQLIALLKDPKRAVRRE